MSMAWVPIDPVEPSSTTSRQTGGALTAPVSGTAAGPAEVAGHACAVPDVAQKDKM